MANIFKQLADDLVESANGKITKSSAGWVFSDAGTTNASGAYLKPRMTKDGRMASIALNLLTVTNCPQPPSDFPVMRDGVSVPMKACRKCPHHIKRFRGRPYPSCEILVKSRAKGPSPAERFVGILDGVKTKAFGMTNV